MTETANSEPRIPYPRQESMRRFNSLAVEKAELERRSAEIHEDEIKRIGAEMRKILDQIQEDWRS